MIIMKPLDDAEIEALDKLLSEKAELSADELRQIIAACERSNIARSQIDDLRARAWQRLAEVLVPPGCLQLANPFAWKQMRSRDRATMEDARGIVKYGRGPIPPYASAMLQGGNNPEDLLTILGRSDRVFPHRLGRQSPQQQAAKQIIEQRDVLTEEQLLQLCKSTDASAAATRTLIERNLGNKVYRSALHIGEFYMNTEAKNLLGREILQGSCSEDDLVAVIWHCNNSTQAEAIQRLLELQPDIRILCHLLLKQDVEKHAGMREAFFAQMTVPLLNQSEKFTCVERMERSDSLSIRRRAIGLLPFMTPEEIEKMMIMFREAGANMDELYTLAQALPEGSSLQQELLGLVRVSAIREHDYKLLMLLIEKCQESFARQTAGEVLNRYEAQARNAPGPLHIHQKIILLVIRNRFPIYDERVEALLPADPRNVINRLQE